MSKKVYDANGNEIKKPIYRKWWFYLIIIAVVIGVSTSGNSSNQKRLTNEQANAGGTDEAGSESVEEDNIYNVGEILQAGDLIITYLSAEDYTDYNEYTAPAEGNKIIMAGFEFENTGSSDTYVSTYDFSCYADGYAAESYIYGSQEYLDSTLSQGKKTKGYVLYEVPEGSTEITIEYETSIWTNEKAIFVVQ